MKTHEEVHGTSACSEMFLASIKIKIKQNAPLDHEKILKPHMRSNDVKALVTANRLDVQLSTTAIAQ